VGFERLSRNGRSDGMDADFDEQVEEFDRRNVLETGLCAEIGGRCIHNPCSGFKSELGLRAAD